MNSPLTFTTEAERLRAREQFVATYRAIFPESPLMGEVGRGFDLTFPPIAPPKMVTEEWWAFIRSDGKREGPFFDRTSKPPPNPGTGYRVARVRVVEVDDA